MTNDHRDRFLHLGTDRREGDSPARAEIVPQAHAQFREPAEPELELDLHPSDEQPFRRCAKCESDNALSARACRNCRSALDTPGQQAFNRALWNRRKAESMAEQGRHADAEQRRADERSRTDERGAAPEYAGRPGVGPVGPALDQRSTLLRLVGRFPGGAVGFSLWLITMTVLVVVGVREMQRPVRNPFIVWGTLIGTTLLTPSRRKRDGWWWFRWWWWH